jgi:hypothetical protein
MASSDHYTQELSAQLGRAAMRGMPHLLITARELHSSLGGRTDKQKRRPKQQPPPKKPNKCLAVRYLELHPLREQVLEAESHRNRR